MYKVGKYTALFLFSLVATAVIYTAMRLTIEVVYYGIKHTLYERVIPVFPFLEDSVVFGLFYYSSVMLIVYLCIILIIALIVKVFSYLYK